jgi:hypothetical protein
MTTRSHFNEPSFVRLKHRDGELIEDALRHIYLRLGTNVRQVSAWSAKPPWVLLWPETPADRKIIEEVASAYGVLA